MTSILWFLDFLHGWHPAVPALLAAVLFVAPRIGVLSWKEFERAISWANFFVIGASLSLAQALISTGAAAWFANSLASPILRLQGLDWAVILMLILLISAVHLGIANMSDCIALMLPVATALPVALRILASLVIFFIALPWWSHSGLPLGP